MAALSKFEEGRAPGAINAPSQWVWGEREAYTRRATLRHTAVGYTIHHLMSIFWATLHEYAFGCTEADDGIDAATHANGAQGQAARNEKSVGRICAEAIATSATAYYVDYHVTPRRLRPGFEKHLSRQSMFAIYASFAAGLAATAIARQLASGRNRARARSADHENSARTFD